MKKALIFVLSLALLLCACNAPIEPEHSNEETSEVSSYYSDIIPPYEFENRVANNPKIHRSVLEESEKEIYDEFLPKVLTYTPYTVDFSESGISYDSFLKVNDAIMDDFPETWLYYSETYEYDVDSCDEEGNPSVFYSGTACYFTLRFTSENIKNFDKNTVDQHIKRIYARCVEIVSKMPDELSVREKYLWLADKICELTEYSEEFEYLYADGPLLYGKGMCQSYAFAYQWLCQTAGLWCITCKGSGIGVAHAWNVVMLDDGHTYYMDLTWEDDSSAEKGKYYFMSYQDCIDTGHALDDGEWIATGP